LHTGFGLTLGETEMLGLRDGVRVCVRLGVAVSVTEEETERVVEPVGRIEELAEGDPVIEAARLLEAAVEGLALPLPLPVKEALDATEPLADTDAATVPLAAVEAVALGDAAREALGLTLPAAEGLTEREGVRVGEGVASLLMLPVQEALAATEALPEADAATEALSEADAATEALAEADAATVPLPEVEAVPLGDPVREALRLPLAPTEGLPEREGVRVDDREADVDPV